MNRKIWVGIAIGAGIGIAYAVTSRNQKSGWERFDAREMRKKFVHQSEDLMERGKEMMDRIRVIVQEGQKVVEDCGELWNRGRKIVRA